MNEMPKQDKKPVSFWYFFIPLTILWIVIAVYVAKIYGSETRGLAYLLASPLIVVGLYFASKRTAALESQSTIDRNRLLTETFSKSIELLGHKEPAVRQGAIYALGKIADTNPEELTVIANTLCAFVRHNKLRRGNETEKEDECLVIDIDAAIKTITKLSDKLERDEKLAKYDLSNINLSGADFSRANLSYFNLSDSIFSYVTFENVNFSNANLVGSRFIDTEFSGAEFDKFTELSTKTQTDKTDLSGAENLTQEQLNKVGDALDDDCKHNCKSKIILPDTLTPPAHWQD